MHSFVNKTAKYAKLI